MEPTAVIVAVVAVVAAAAGLAVGVALGGARRQAQLDRARADAASARADLAAARATLRGEEALLDSFRSLSSQALAASADQLVALTEARWGSLEERSRAESAQRHQALGSLVGPVGEKLTDLDRKLAALERERASESSSLRQMVEQLRSSTESLHDETRLLARAMRDTRARGSWGELQLRRVVELAGMVPHCDFVEQATVSGLDGRLRPDLVVRLPAAKAVVVDAKVPLQSWLEAVDTDDPDRERLLLAEHARAVAAHVDALQGREYARFVDGAVDFVVMFVPGDAFLAAAYEARPSLFEDAIAKGVFLATPGTLIALLRAVAYGWRQERLAESSAEIAALGRELHKRLTTFTEHLARTGTALDRAARSYNDAVGSLESRVLVTARRLAEHGADDGELPVLEPVEVAVRAVRRPDDSEADAVDEAVDDADPPQARTAG